jgi:Cd(II)/Pb(II)-responsive transcriptional regulator
MRIGELAERTSTPVDTIRYYEKVGLLPAVDRSAGNYRAYGPAQVQRLNFIRRCRALDMSLDEIRALLDFCDAPSRDCGAVNTLLDEHLAHVETRLRDLQRLARELRQLRSACRSPGAAEQCRILRELRQPNSGSRRATAHGRSTHESTPNRGTARGGSS